MEFHIAGTVLQRGAHPGATAGTESLVQPRRTQPPHATRRRRTAHPAGDTTIHTYSRTYIKLKENVASVNLDIVHYSTYLPTY